MSRFFITIGAFVMLKGLLSMTALGQANSVLTTNNSDEKGARYDEGGPDPIYATAGWKQAKIGEMYHGYMKLSAEWVRGFPNVFLWEECGQEGARAMKLEKVSDAIFPNLYRRNRGLELKEGNLASQILDPQGYLNEEEEAMVIEVLRSHEQLSRVPIDLFVFGSEQQLETMTPQKVGEQYLDKRNTALMYYFMGDARATSGYVNGGVDEEGESLLDAYQVKNMYTKAGIYAAGLNQGRVEDLCATVTEVSRRMYWIEQELGLTTPLDIDAYEQEVAEVKVKKPSRLTKYWGTLKDSIGKYVGGDARAVFVVVAILSLLVVVSCFKVFKAIYIRVNQVTFPEYNGPTRLGADYGAGVSEIIEFKDARISLSEQKRKLRSDEI